MKLALLLSPPAITVAIWTAVEVQSVHSSSNAAPIPSHNSVLDAPNPALLTRYLKCSAEAERRVLSAAEANECGESYLELKLSFLPEVGPSEFQAMNVEQKVLANRQGYEALRTWHQENLQR